MNEESLVKLIYSKGRIDIEVIKSSKSVESEPAWAEILFIFSNKDEVATLLNSNNTKEVSSARHSLEYWIQYKTGKDYLLEPCKRLLDRLEKTSLGRIRGKSVDQKIQKSRIDKIKIELDQRAESLAKGRGIFDSNLEKQFLREMNLRKDAKRRRSRYSKIVPPSDQEKTRKDARYLGQLDAIRKNPLQFGLILLTLSPLIIIALPKPWLLNKENVIKKIVNSGISVKYEPDCRIQSLSAIGEYSPDSNEMCLKSSIELAAKWQDEFRTLTHETVHAIQDCNNPGHEVSGLHNWTLTPLGTQFNVHKLKPRLHTNNWHAVSDPIEREAYALEPYPNLVFNEILPKVCTTS